MNLSTVLLSVMEQRRPDWVPLLRRAITQHDAVPLDLDDDDLRQLLDGFCAVVEEELRGYGRQAWYTYFETVVPGVLASDGESLPRVVRTVGGLFVLLVDDIVRHLPEPELQPAAVDWMSRFFSRWLGQLACGVDARA